MRLKVQVQDNGTWLDDKDNVFDGGAAVAIASAALLDCVVSNCVASRGAAVFGGTVERCLLANNVVASGGNAITRTGWVRSSVYTRNLGNTTVGQDSRAHNCTVVSNYSALVHLYSGTSSTSASNTLFAANAGGNDIERVAGTDFCVYEDLASGKTLLTSVKETTLFADYLHDDFRPYAASAGSYFGDPRAFADGSCFADFHGKPFPISANGKITAGAVSDLVTSLKVVSPVPGGTDVEGVVDAFPVTVTATRADRQLSGFEVNGATQTVSGTSVTLTADQVAGFTSFTARVQHGLVGGRDERQRRQHGLECVSREEDACRGDVPCLGGRYGARAARRLR